MTDIKPGDRIEIIRKGVSSGLLGTVRTVTNGFDGTVFVSVMLDTFKKNRLITYGTEQDFKKVEISKTEFTT